MRTLGPPGGRSPLAAVSQHVRYISDLAENDRAASTGLGEGGRRIKTLARFEVVALSVDQGLEHVLLAASWDEAGDRDAITSVRMSSLQKYSPRIDRMRIA